jgi:hypothetical protein
MITRDELVKQFDEAVPLMFQSSACKIIERAYTAADDARDAHGLQTPMARWHRPLLRRALIESQLSELAAAYSPTLTPVWCNAACEANPYLEIKACGFTITVAKIEGPGMLPREADYRSASSEVNYTLFPDAEESDGTKYAILSHVAALNGQRPDFVYFLFPDSDYTRVLYHIDLRDRFGGEGGVPVVPVTPKVDPMPTLKTVRPAKRKGGAQS